MADAPSFREEQLQFRGMQVLFTLVSVSVWWDADSGRVYTYCAVRQHDDRSHSEPERLSGAGWIGMSTRGNQDIATSLLAQLPCRACTQYFRGAKALRTADDDQIGIHP